MFRFVIVSLSLVSLTLAQGNYHQNPQTAAIISEQRYLTGDGKFGAAYTQEDGINFKEETDSDGTRHGSYSYVDPTGQRRTISYTAGKNGFQASGDHLPVAPAAPPQVAPQPHYQPLPQYQPPAPAPAPVQQYRDNYEDDGSYDPRYNDPSYSRSQQPHASYHAPAPPVPQAPVAPQHPAPAYHHQQAPAYYNHNFQHQPNYNHPQAPHTTQIPHRFQPPGKLSLNRTPDGFIYKFDKV